MSESFQAILKGAVMTCMNYTIDNLHVFFPYET